MPKDYVGKKVGKILMPGDPGYNDPRLPWGGIRNAVGWQKPDAIQVPLAGFFLIDRRTNPPVAIFKNRVIVGNAVSKFGDEPIPFASLDETLHHKEKMHLSMADAQKVSPVGLTPDPGLGNPRPNMIFVDKHTARNM